MVPIAPSPTSTPFWRRSRKGFWPPAWASSFPMTVQCSRRTGGAPDAAPPAPPPLLRLERVRDEVGHVLLELGQLVDVDVHHVAGLVLVGDDARALRGIEVEVRERVFGGEEGRRQVVVARGHE